MVLSQWHSGGITLPKKGRGGTPNLARLCIVKQKHIVTHVASVHPPAPGIGGAAPGACGVLPGCDSRPGSVNKENNSEFWNKSEFRNIKSRASQARPSIGASSKTKYRCVKQSTAPCMTWRLGQGNVWQGGQPPSYTRQRVAGRAATGLYTKTSDHRSEHIRCSACRWN